MGTVSDQPTPASNFAAGSSRRLAELMQPADRANVSWTPSDIQAIYRHQLATPINVELAGVDRATADRLRELCDSNGLTLRGIGDLLAHPSPPLELLVIIKEFAKASLEHPESALPKEVSSAIYWACIAVAMVRCNARISSLSAGQAVDGLQWALRQEWLAADRRDVLQAALNAFGEARHP